MVWYFYDGYYQKVDRAVAGLGPDSRPDGYLFCYFAERMPAPPEPDVKGKIKCSAALDIYLHRRYVVEKMAAGFLSYRPE